MDTDVTYTQVLSIKIQTKVLQTNEILALISETFLI